MAIQSLARGSKARKKAKQDMALHAWTQLENNEESEFHVNNRDVASQVTREIRRKYGAGEEPKALLQTATQRRLSRSVYGTTPRASISEAALMAEQIPDSYTVGRRVCGCGGRREGQKCVSWCVCVCVCVCVGSAY